MNYIISGLIALAISVGGYFVNHPTLVGTAPRVFTVQQGGTGAATLTGCLTGNGTGAITGSGSACAGSGSTFPFTTTANYNSTTSVIGFFNGLFSNASSTFSKINITYGSSTAYSSFVVASTSNFILNGSNFYSLIGTGLTNSSGILTVAVVPNSALANSTISGVSLGGTLGSLTATDNTLTFSASYNGSASRTVGLNLGNANIWTALQSFYSNASSTQFSSNIAWIGGTGTTTIGLNGSILVGTTTPWQNSMLNVVGTTTIKGQATSIMASTTAGATSPFTVDWSNGNTQRYTLSANGTFIINATSSNPIAGAKYVLYICQDTAGSRTITFGTSVIDWPVVGATGLQNATTASVMTAKKANAIGMIYDGIDQRYKVLASTTINCQP